MVVHPGIKSSNDAKILKESRQEIVFTPQKPKIEITGDGYIIPNASGLFFPFKAVKVKAVNVRVVEIFGENIHQFFQTNQISGVQNIKQVGRVVLEKTVTLEKGNEGLNLNQWNHYSLDLNELNDHSPGSIYRVIVGFNQEQAIYDCAEKKESLAQFASLKTPMDLGVNDINYWDYNGFDGANYDRGFNWEDRMDPCKKSYYMNRQTAVARNVFASNLGIIAKAGVANEIFVATSNILTAEPEGHVEIELYNFQQEKIGEGITESSGTTSVRYEGGKPFLLVAKKGNEQNYLRMDDGSSLSLSMFDVGGTKK